MIAWDIERTQATGLRFQSAFVLLYDDGLDEYRVYEVTHVPLEADAAAHVETFYDPAWMWQQGQAVADARLDVALLRAQVDDALADIDDEIAAVPDATTAQLKAILVDILRRQRRLIRAVARVLKQFIVEG